MPPATWQLCDFTPSEPLHSLLCEWDAKSHCFLEMRILQATIYSFLSTVPATEEGLKKCYYYFLLPKYIHTTQTSHSITTNCYSRCFVYPEPLSISVHGQEREEREPYHTLGYSFSNLTAQRSGGGAVLLISPFLNSSPEILVQWGLGNVHFLTSLLGYTDAGGLNVDLDLCTLEHHLYEGHTLPLRKMITTSQATPGVLLHWLQRIRWEVAWRSDGAHKPWRCLTHQ